MRSIKYDFLWTDRFIMFTEFQNMWINSSSLLFIWAEASWKTHLLFRFQHFPCHIICLIKKQAKIVDSVLSLYRTTLLDTRWVSENTAALCLLRRCPVAVINAPYLKNLKFVVSPPPWNFSFKETTVSSPLGVMQHRVKHPWPRRGVFDLTTPGFEFRIMCLEGSVSWFLSLSA